MTCKCGNIYLILKLKLIPTSKPAPYPKYVPMVGLYCDAGHWIKWQKQTQNIIDAINETLELGFQVAGAQNLE